MAKSVKTIKNETKLQIVKKVKAIGRPTKYNPKYCVELIEFFSKDPLAINDDSISEKGGWRKERLPSRIPWFEAFARKIGVHVDTLHEWRKVYPEFSEAYNTAKDLQREFLVDLGMSGKAPSSFAIFTMKNVCGWRDEKDLKIKEEKANKDLTDEELDEIIYGNTEG